MVAQHDALAELAQLGPRQHVPELRLPDEHDLDQLGARGLEIREQPDLLEHLRREVLRFVDDQQRGLVLLEAADQEVVQREQVLGLGVARGLDPVLVEQHAEEVEGLEAGIEDEGRQGLPVELRQQAVQQHGLPGADLAGQQHESLVGVHPVDERRQALAVHLAEIQERRVGRHLERAAQESVVLVVHGGSPLSSSVPRPAPARRRRARRSSASRPRGPRSRSSSPPPHRPAPSA